MFSIPIKVDRNANVIQGEKDEMEGGITDRSANLQNHRLRFLRKEKANGGQSEEFLEEKLEQSTNKYCRGILSSAKRDQLSSFKKNHL
jgi:hypothetical protein